MLICCNGERTEPDYLRGLANQRDNPAIRVKVQTRAVDPRRLVRAAADFLRETDDLDEVWCVSDVDEFDIEPAQMIANEHGVQLVLSKPCFEYWLLLHHVDCRRPGMTPAQVLALLRLAVPAYSKTQLRFADFADGVDAAIRRAKSDVDSEATQPGDPSSGMWTLLERVFGSNNQESR